MGAIQLALAVGVVYELLGTGESDGGHSHTVGIGRRRGGAVVDHRIPIVVTGIRIRALAHIILRGAVETPGGDACPRHVKVDRHAGRIAGNERVGGHVDGAFNSHQAVVSIVHLATVQGQVLKKQCGGRGLMSQQQLARDAI